MNNKCECCRLYSASECGLYCLDKLYEENYDDDDPMLFEDDSLLETEIKV